MRIIFMGTPHFAVPTLQKLLDAGKAPVAVYTQPPRPAGRGKKPRPSPIHALALEHDIPVHTPQTLHEESVLEEFLAWEADVVVVAAYGLLLPKKVLQACPFGCINIHPSLLPRWRGAAPIQRAIMAGDHETGVCIMQMDEGLDTGDILAKEVVELAPDVTADILHDQLAALGAALLCNTIEHLPSITPEPQGEAGATYAAKITKEEGKIVWTEPGEVIARLVRALHPSPAAYFYFHGQKIKVLAAEYTPGEAAETPGTVLNDQLTIACGGGTLTPTLVQRQGKKPMPSDALLRGFDIPKGSVLS